MYSIAATVRACLGAGAPVTVAWTVATADLGPQVPARAVAFTPDGTVGGVLDEQLDARLAEIAAQLGDGPGRVVELAVTSGDTPGGTVLALVVPAALLPGELWDALAERRPVALVIEAAGGIAGRASVFTETTIDTAPADVTAAFARRARAVTALADDRLATVLWPEPQLVLAGTGAYAESIAELATWLGWRVDRVADPGTATALAAALGPADAAVVVGHDFETTGHALRAALAGRAGYVAALGSWRVRQRRAAWLTEHGVADLGRLHMPAGLDLDARTPREVALSVLAEAQAVRTGASARPLGESPA